MGYLYETHMHTCQASACGRSTGKEHARFYKEAGYTGIIMTDHFFGGNTAVDRHLPWEDRIDWFFEGYEDALEEGKRIGLDVFFGLEQNYDGDEYLIYGLNREYITAHPEMERWTRRQQLEEVHKAGGCVIQAHPFRIRDYMEKIIVGEGYCDGIEVANAGNTQLDDARAMIYGRERGLLMTAGSDNHRSPPSRETFGIVLEKKLTCIEDYVKIIRNREKIVLHVPEDRFDWNDEWEMTDRHRAFFLNEKEQAVPSDREWSGRRKG